MSDTFRKVVKFPVGIQTTKEAVAAQDIPNIAQVYSLIRGTALRKEAVAIDTNENIDLATGGLLTLDGYTLQPFDRVLVGSQTDPVENGIYTATIGAWSRVSDADTAEELVIKTSVTVLNGPHAGRMYELQEDRPVVDTDPQTWVVVSSSSSAALDVTVDDGSFTSLSGNNVQAALYSTDSLFNDRDGRLGNLSGAGQLATNMGAFNGSTIGDNQSIKSGMQDLETAHESLEAQLQALDDNIARTRFQTNVITLTQGVDITINHQIGLAYLSSVAVWDSTTGEDISHTVTVTRVDGNNITVRNDDADVNVVVVCKA